VYSKNEVSAAFPEKWWNNNNALLFDFGKPKILDRDVVQVVVGGRPTIFSFSQ
jgi:hypothetical protein